MKKETILVTGSAGFIGFHLSTRLLAEGHTVVGLDNFNDYYSPVLKEQRSQFLKKHKNFTEYRCDINDYDTLTRIAQSHNLDKVCHLAAQAGVRYSIDNPHVYAQANLVGFLNILELVRHNNIPRLVYASSSSVYGGNKEIPFSESANVDNPISLYAATKKANELMAHCYTNLYGFQTVGLRFFTVYGPWGRPDMAMWLFAEAIKAKKAIKVFNHGKMKRDFTFVDDIVQGICGSLFSTGLDQYEVFNLGNNRTENLMDMIGLIEDGMGQTAEKEYMPLQPGDVPETYADISKAVEKLNFQPTTPIAIGVPKFISWYKEHAELTDQIRLERS